MGRHLAGIETSDTREGAGFKHIKFQPAFNPCSTLTSINTKLLTPTGIASLEMMEKKPNEVLFKISVPVGATKGHLSLQKLDGLTVIDNKSGKKIELISDDFNYIIELPTVGLHDLTIIVNHRKMCM